MTTIPTYKANDKEYAIVELEYWHELLETWKWERIVWLAIGAVTSSAFWALVAVLVIAL